MPNKKIKYKEYTLAHDSLFKYFFKHDYYNYYFKCIIKHYLNIDIDEFIFLDNEINNMQKKHNKRLDILMVNREKETLLNIEMNNGYHKNMQVKNELYLYSLINYASQSLSFKEPKVIQISFNNYYYRNKNYVDIEDYKLRGKKYDLEKKTINVKEMYIPRLIELDDCKYSKWLKMFTEKDLSKLKKEIGGDKFMEKMITEEERARLNDFVENIYNFRKHLEIQEGEKRGEKRGIAETRLETAKRLLQQNVDVSIISNATDLSQEKIKSLMV